MTKTEKVFGVTIFGCTLFSVYLVTKYATKKQMEKEAAKEEVKEDVVEETKETKEEETESIVTKIKKKFKKFKILTKKVWHKIYDKYLDCMQFLTTYLIDMQVFTILLSFIASIYSVRTARLQFIAIQRGVSQRKTGADAVGGVLSTFLTLNNVRRYAA